MVFCGSGDQWVRRSGETTTDVVALARGAVAVAVRGAYVRRAAVPAAPAQDAVGVSRTIQVPTPLEKITRLIIRAK